MAMEPINVFSRTVDPAGVARLLREIAPRVEIEGPDDGWTSAVVAFGDRTLSFNHDPSYYGEPNWSVQMNGMRAYFARFPETIRKERALLLITSFKFSLACLFEPDFDPEGDPRFDVLFAVAGFLDGVFFTPSSLRNARGRILFGAGGEGEEDPKAVWPRVAGAVTIDRSTPPDEQDEEDQPAPPTAERVARRALALTAVTMRAMLEQRRGSWLASSRYRTLLAWVGDVGLDDELEPDEWEVLQRPVGRLEPDQQINSTWRLEGLVVLAWALGRSTIPSHDRLVNPKRLWRSLTSLDPEAAAALLASPMLRPRGEIGALRNHLFALHWRLRNYHLNRTVMDFAGFARTCWFGPLDLTGLRLLKGDLALRGRRIDRASGDSFNTAHRAALERHQAANWLWDGPERYSEASVDT